MMCHLTPHEATVPYTVIFNFLPIIFINSDKYKHKICSILHRTELSIIITTTIKIKNTQIHPSSAKNLGFLKVYSYHWVYFQSSKPLLIVDGFRICIKLFSDMLRCG